MGISLLGYLGNTGANAATSTATKKPTVQTTTPAVQKSSYVDPGVQAATMGVQAKTPTATVSQPATTLPAAQAKPIVSAPVSAPVTYKDPITSINNGGSSPYTYDASGNLTGSTFGAKAPDTGSTGNQQPSSTQPYSSTNPPTYSGLIGQAANLASGPSQDYLNQQAQANAYNEALKQSRINEAGGLAQNAQNPIPLEFQQGRAQVLQNQYAQEQAALGSAFQGASTLQGAANTQQGLQQTGLYQAAGLAAPQLGSIGSQQYYNPLNPGQSTGGTGTAMSQLPAQAQTAIQSYAQEVKSGAMTRADAESRLSAYGITGTNALNEALGTGFNTNASNASAGTTATGQQIQTAAASTNAALDTLGTAFANLSPAQTAGIPATNAIANWIGTQLGSDALQKFKTNLADARSQLIGVLNSSGGTPTGNEATANQYLPDNMTKAQFDANVGTVQNPGIVRQLIQQKVGAFTTSGTQSNQNANSTGSGLYNF